jgi:uncharacterized protein YktB (UPF0637 family)
MSGKEFTDKMEETFKTLLPLYTIAQKAAVS